MIELYCNKNSLEKINEGRGVKFTKEVNNFIRLDADKDNITAICAKSLRDDQIIAMPSDSVYGLFARRSLQNAKIMHEIKQRPLEKSFLCVLPENYNIEELCNIEAWQSSIISEKWPGKNSLIFSKKSEVDYPMADTIGLRKPNSNSHGLYYETLQKVKAPLLAPSLNLSDETPYTDLNEIIEKLGHRLDMILIDTEFVPSEPSKIFFLLEQGKLEQGKLERAR